VSRSPPCGFRTARIMVDRTWTARKPAAAPPAGAFQQEMAAAGMIQPGPRPGPHAQEALAPVFFSWLLIVNLILAKNRRRRALRKTAVSAVAAQASGGDAHPRSDEAVVGDEHIAGQRYSMATAMLLASPKSAHRE